MRKSTFIPTGNGQFPLSKRKSGHVWPTTPQRQYADTPIRFCPHWQLTLAIFFLALMLLVPGVRAAETEYASQPTTLLELEVAVRANPRRAAATVTQFLESGPTGSVSFVGQSVSATMRGLGPWARQAAIGRVMLAVTKARPDAVLEIIRVAIPLTKKDSHQEIVAASVSGIAAVSDLYMPVSVKPAGGGAVGYETCHSTTGEGPVRVVAGMSFVECATLAEDIVQVAFQSGSHENLAALSQSANGVLVNQATPDSLASWGQIPNRRLEFTAPAIEITPLPTPAPASQ